MNAFFYRKFPVLKNVGMRKLILSRFLSQAGGYIQNVALSALITEKTQSGYALGIFLCVSYAPVFLLSYFFGRLVKPERTRQVLVVCESVLFGMSVLLCFAADMPFRGFLAFGAVWGTVRALQAPIDSSMPKLLCDTGSLTQGVAALNLAISLSRAVGPTVSGAVYTAFSYRAAFAVNAASYIPSLLLLCGIKQGPSRKTDKKPSESVKSRLCLPLLALVFAVSFAGTPYNVIFTGLSQRLSLGRLWFSVFMALIGVGAVLGACLMRSGKSSAVTALGISAGAAVLGLSSRLWVICIAITAYGLCDYLFFTFALTEINSQNSEKTVSRAMGVYTAVTSGALPLGSLCLGYAVQKLSVSPVLIFISVWIAAAYAVFSGKFR